MRPLVAENWKHGRSAGEKQLDISKSDLLSILGKNNCLSDSVTIPSKPPHCMQHPNQNGTESYPSGCQTYFLDAYF